MLLHYQIEKLFSIGRLSGLTKNRPNRHKEIRADCRAVSSNHELVSPLQSYATSAAQHFVSLAEVFSIDFHYKSTPFPNLQMTESLLKIFRKDKH
jgi:hypothetical protein